MDLSFSIADQRIFRKFFHLLMSVNPDDVTAKMYSEDLISTTEREEINSPALTMPKRKVALLEALERAIMCDQNKFIIFLNILAEVNKYQALVDNVRAELKKTSH